MIKQENIVYVKPTLLDIDEMQKLVKPEVDDGIILPRNDDEMATNIRAYVVAKFNNKIIGFCALHIFSKKLAEIRSLVVDKSYRRNKVGQNMILFLIEESQKLCVNSVFALTYQKGFFEKLGFSMINKSELPEQKIWADCIKCKYFPVCKEIAFIKQI